MNMPLMLARIAAAHRNTGPADPYWSNVSCLMHFDALKTDGSLQFIDAKGNTWNSPAVGGSAIDTTIKKFGGGSHNPSTGNAYAQTTTSSPFAFGSGDFTVEAQLYRDTNDLPNYHGAVCADDIGTTRGWLLFANVSNGFMNFAGFSGATSFTVADTIIPALSTWYHYAVVRDGSTLRMYRDGAQVASVPITGTINDAGAGCRVGGLINSANISSVIPWKGRIDEVRVTKGVCRYPNGTTFTPPAAPFPNR